jgi:hypothetical protein
MRLEQTKGQPETFFRMSEQGHLLLGLGDVLDGGGRHVFGLFQTLGQSAAQVLAHGELQSGIQSSPVYGKWDNVCATIEVITLLPQFDMKVRPRNFCQ